MDNIEQRTRGRIKDREEKIRKRRFFVFLPPSLFPSSLLLYPLSFSLIARSRATLPFSTVFSKVGHGFLVVVKVEH